MVSLVFFGLGMELGGIALWLGGAWLLLLWPALSFTLVGIAYWARRARIFGKAGRTFRFAPQLVLLPYLTLCSLLWHALRLLLRERAWQRVTPSLYIGRRLLAHEFPGGIASVVDLTSELYAAVPSYAVTYVSLPILDGTAPSVSELLHSVRTISQLPKPIYLHCAQGHGRTGLVAAALLLADGLVSTPEQALTKLKTVRPGLRLNHEQRRRLAELRHAPT